MCLYLHQERNISTNQIGRCVRAFSMLETANGLSLAENQLQKCLDTCKMMISQKRLATMCVEKPSFSQTNSNANAKVYWGTTVIKSISQAQTHLDQEFIAEEEQRIQIKRLQKKNVASTPSGVLLDPTKILEKESGIYNSKEQLTDIERYEKVALEDKINQSQNLELENNQVRQRNDKQQQNKQKQKAERDEILQRIYSHDTKKPLNYHDDKKQKILYYVYADPNITYGLPRTVQEIEQEQKNCYIPNPQFLKDCKFPQNMPELPQEFQTKGILQNPSDERDKIEEKQRQINKDRQRRRQILSKLKQGKDVSKEELNSINIDELKPEDYEQLEEEDEDQYERDQFEEEEDLMKNAIIGPDGQIRSIPRVFLKLQEDQPQSDNVQSIPNHQILQTVYTVDAPPMSYRFHVRQREALKNSKFIKPEEIDLIQKEDGEDPEAEWYRQKQLKGLDKLSKPKKDYTKENRKKESYQNDLKKKNVIQSSNQVKKMWKTAPANESKSAYIPVGQIRVLGNSLTLQDELLDKSMQLSQPLYTQRQTSQNISHIQQSSQNGQQRPPSTNKLQVSINLFETKMIEQKLNFLRIRQKQEKQKEELRQARLRRRHGQGANDEDTKNQLGLILEDEDEQINNANSQNQQKTTDEDEKEIQKQTEIVTKLAAYQTHPKDEQIQQGIQSDNIIGSPQKEDIKDDVLEFDYESEIGKELKIDVNDTHDQWIRKIKMKKMFTFPSKSNQEEQYNEDYVQNEQDENQKLNIIKKKNNRKQSEDQQAANEQPHIFTATATFTYEAPKQEVSAAPSVSSVTQVSIPISQRPDADEFLSMRSSFIKKQKGLREKEVRLKNPWSKHEEEEEEDEEDQYYGNKWRGSPFSVDSTSFALNVREIVKSDAQEQKKKVEQKKWDNELRK
ncbi:MAG: hypothetical protein EZS28_021413 [Streblomastix strix]|uniref:Uncharacterized protein n=1 Tax=Streblomastix strix TaxID=222440 RepID=A0A5J4VL42_9EUKA|nr:MAG: hypothetical protein EZS28_021413 [Streblomastix strix]